MLEVDGKVVYVGKGHGKRMFYHRFVLDHPLNKQNERPMYADLRRKVGEGPLTERIVFSTTNETTALLHESKLIKDFGIENLVNVATHAFTGRKMKPIVGQLISKKLRAYVEKCREKYGTGQPPEVIEKIRHSNKITRANLSPIKALQWSRRISEGKSGILLTSSHRAALRKPKTIVKTKAFIQSRKEASRKMSEINRMKRLSYLSPGEPEPIGKRQIAAFWRRINKQNAL